EDLVQRLTAGPVLASEPLSESGPELRDLLNRMLIDKLKLQETEAISAAAKDPQALARYREYSSWPCNRRQQTAEQG
ncbi:MAG: DNA primase, partial [Betaproteobacteria bacterium]|nr:DNA primase [Betaproteobacteria bacterium]